MDAQDDQRWADGVRGLLLGLGCGDALGRAVETGDGADGLERVPAGVGSQLAAATVDGIIRALVRSRHQGIDHPLTVIWHAYCRWAWAQGLDAEVHHAEWSTRTEGTWPDGWLVGVSLLGRRRGDAPTVAAALRGQRPGTPHEPVAPGQDAQSLVRSLPLAATGRAGWADLPRLGAECAALTDGNPVAQTATALAVRVLAEALVAPSVEEAVDRALGSTPGFVADVTEANEVERAEARARTSPALTSVLEELAPDDSARSALRAGVYVALSFPDPADATAAVSFAALAPHPSPVAAVAGALLGAVHGLPSLSPDLVSRLELGWVLDTLARDLVQQVVLDPSGGPWTDAVDPGWRGRYPGW